jgi:hypothetical protein
LIFANENISSYESSSSNIVKFQENLAFSFIITFKSAIIARSKDNSFNEEKELKRVSMDNEVDISSIFNSNRRDYLT